MKYEMMIIIKPVEERLVQATIDKVLGYVKEAGTLIDIDKLGRRRLRCYHF